MSFGYKVKQKFEGQLFELDLCSARSRISYSALYRPYTYQFGAGLLALLLKDTVLLVLAGPNAANPPSANVTAIALPDAKFLVLAQSTLPTAPFSARIRYLPRPVSR